MKAQCLVKNPLKRCLLSRKKNIIEINVIFTRIISQGTVDNNLQLDHIAGPNDLDIPSIADKQPFD